MPVKPRKTKIPVCVRCGCGPDAPVHKFHVEGNPRTHAFATDLDYWNKKRAEGSLPQS